MKAAAKQGGLREMVGGLQFILWRLLGDEPKLLALSTELDDLLAELSGLTVALVGNSRALAQGFFGADIDEADIVIRINRAPMPGAQSHGRRTDWLALATSLPRTEADRTRPRRILWMSPKRKRLRRWMVKSDGFYLHPLPRYRQLLQALASPPTTGLMLIDLIAGSDARAIKIYGFDFFASRSLTGSRTAAQVPHDFDSEKAWVANLTRQDERIQLIG